MNGEQKRQNQWKIAKTLWIVVGVMAFLLVVMIGCVAIMSGGSTTTNNNVQQSTDSTQLLSDAQKKKIQNSMEMCIDNKYKGPSYTVDILTPTEGSGAIVSTQLDGEINSEDECREAVKEIIGKMIPDPTFKEIIQFDFNFVSDYKMKYYSSIKNVQNIKSAEELSTLEITEVQ